MHHDRIRMESLWKRVTGAEEAASPIRNGMTVGGGDFTRSGDAKAVPPALAASTTSSSPASPNTRAAFSYARRRSATLPR
jgi:acyl-CoA hydrolase